MLESQKNRDVIVLNAIEIPSVPEREAYIASACGDDAELRRQVEEQVAAHFQTKNLSEKPPAAAATSALPSRQAPQQAGPQQGDHGEEQPRRLFKLWTEARKYSHVLAMAAVLLLLSAVVGSTSLAVWSLREKKETQMAEQRVVEELQHIRKTEAEVKQQRDWAAAAEQNASKERDQALAEGKAAKESVEDTKMVLAFLQAKLLSTGRSTGWSGGQGQSATLRQAIDAAELKVSEAFTNRPLAEASARETLGETYLDFGEAMLAIKQYERALALRQALQGQGHADTSACRNKLAVAYRHAGRFFEAGSLFNQKPRDPTHADALALDGLLLLSQKKPAEAELKLCACLVIRQELQPNYWTMFDAKSMLGKALLDQKKYAEAEPLLLSGYEGMKQCQAQIPSQNKMRLIRTLERLVQLYEVWGRKDKAVKWRNELEAVKSKERKSDHPNKDEHSRELPAPDQNQ